MRTISSKRRIVSGIITLAMLFSLSGPALAAESASATSLRLESAEGTVTVRDASGGAKAIRDGMRLYSGYTVETAAASAAYLSLDETKAVKLDSLTRIEVKKSGKKLEAALSTGQLFFNVTSPLQTDESLNIRTATIVTGIRGSFGWVSPTKVGLMHGHVEVTTVDQGTGAAQTEHLYSGEMVTYQPAAAPGTEGPVPGEGELVKEAIRTEDVPAVAAEEVARDETLQQQLTEDVPALDVAELIESVPEKQAERTEQETKQVERAEQAASEQQDTIVQSAAADTATDTAGTDQMFQAATAPAGVTASGSSSSPSYSSGSSGGGSSGGGSSSGGSTQPAAAVPVTDAGAISQTLEKGSNVSFSGQGSTDTLSVPAGSTLTTTAGSSLTLTDSGVNQGTIVNYGTLTVDGDLSNLSDHTVRNFGTLIINGTFINGGTAAGTFVNNGTVTFGEKGRFYNKANGVISGTAIAGKGLYYAVSFVTNGGGGSVAALDIQNGTTVASLPTPTSSTAGSSFLGWFADAALTTLWKSGTAVTGNVVLYAKWSTPQAPVTASDCIFVEIRSAHADQSALSESSGAAAGDIPLLFSAFVNGEKTEIALSLADGEKLIEQYSSIGYAMFTSMSSSGGLVTLSGAVAPVTGTTKADTTDPTDYKLELDGTAYKWIPSGSNATRCFLIENDDIVQSRIVAIPTSSDTTAWSTTDSSGALTYVFWRKGTSQQTVDTSKAAVLRSGVGGAFGNKGMVELLLDDGKGTIVTYEADSSVNAAVSDAVYYDAAGTGDPIGAGDVVSYTVTDDNKVQLKRLAKAAGIFAAKLPNAELRGDMTESGESVQYYPYTVWFGEYPMYVQLGMDSYGTISSSSAGCAVFTTAKASSGLIFLEGTVEPETGLEPGKNKRLTIGGFSYSYSDAARVFLVDSSGGAVSELSGGVSAIQSSYPDADVWYMTDSSNGDLTWLYFKKSASEAESEVNVSITLPAPIVSPMSENDKVSNNRDELQSYIEQKIEATYPNALVTFTASVSYTQSSENQARNVVYVNAGDTVAIELTVTLDDSSTMPFIVKVYSDGYETSEQPIEQTDKLYRNKFWYTVR